MCLTGIQDLILAVTQWQVDEELDAASPSDLQMQDILRLEMAMFLKPCRPVNRRKTVQI